MHSVRAMHPCLHMLIGIMIVHMPPKLVLAKLFIASCQASVQPAVIMRAQ